MRRLQNQVMLVLFLGVLMHLTPAPVQGQKKPMKKDEPRIVVTRPLGITVGGKQRLTVRGLKLDKVSKARFDGLSIPVKIVSRGGAGVPNQQQPDQVGNTQAEIEVELPAETKGEALSLILVTPDGETAPHMVALDRQAPVVEKEPNPGFRQSQPISVPCIVAGEISQPQDVDVLGFEGRKGQRLLIEVEAARLGSALDAYLLLTDARGAILATSDDTSAGPDARIELVLPRDGLFYLTLLDAHDQGGAAHVYRLIFKNLKAKTGNP